MDKNKFTDGIKKIDKESAYLVGRAAMTGGVGKAGRTAAELATYNTVSKAAQKTASRIEKRKKENSQKEVTPVKKMQGIGFYIILLMCVVEDLLDIILSLVTPITSVILTFIIFTYLILEKVDFNSRTIARWVISFIIELIPVVNIIPTYSIIFFLTKTFENNASIKKATETLQVKRSVNITRKKRG